jgi:MFS family permease
MLFPTRTRHPELYPYRHGLYFAFYHALNWQVVIGTPTVLFMQHLGADSFQVGLVFAWTFLLTPVQVIATALLPHLGFKKLTLFGWNARAWFLLVPLGLACLAPAQPSGWMISGMVIAMFCYAVYRAIGTAAITPWLYQIVPEDIRGSYWATDQMLSAVAGLGILILCAGIFVVLPPYSAFQVQYLIAVFGALTAYRALMVLPDVPKPKLISLERILTETPRLLTQRGLYRTYLYQSFPLFIAITPLPPFTVFYLKTTHGTPAAVIMLYAMLTYLGVITANVIMRSRLDRIGAKPFFRLSYAGYSFSALGWLAFLYFGATLTLLVPVLFFVQGFAGGSWTSANLNYLARIVPAEDRALPVSLHSAVITFLGGTAPVIWGLFLKDETGRTVREPVFAAFFIVVLLVMLVLASLLHRLPEKELSGEPLMQGAWLLRPLRGLASLISLIDRSPDKPPGPPEKEPPKS